MNKIIIALGLSLAAATGAFAESNFGPDRSPTTPANELVTYNKGGDAGIDYTATASIEAGSDSVAAINSKNPDRVLNFGH